MAEESPSQAPAPKPAANPLAKFPSAVRDAHKRFLDNGDIESLDLVVLAVVRDHQPSHLRATTPEKLADEAKLMADLGFDSLALAEIVFFLEDLYKVSITNEEIMSISTVGDLRAFVRRKVSAAANQPAVS